jgi:hypothetical protein
MSENQLNLMVHDLGSEIILKYGNSKCSGILHAEFDK